MWCTFGDAVRCGGGCRIASSGSRLSMASIGPLLCLVVPPPPPPPPLPSLFSATTDGGPSSITAGLPPVSGSGVAGVSSFVVDASISGRGGGSFACCSCSGGTDGLSSGLCSGEGGVGGGGGVSAAVSVFGAPALLSSLGGAACFKCCCGSTACPCLLKVACFGEVEDARAAYAGTGEVDDRLWAPVLRAAFPTGSPSRAVRKRCGYRNVNLDVDMMKPLFRRRAAGKPVPQNLKNSMACRATWLHSPAAKKGFRFDSSCSEGEVEWGVLSPPQKKLWARRSDRDDRRR